MTLFRVRGLVRSSRENGESYSGSPEQNIDVRSAIALSLKGETFECSINIPSYCSVTSLSQEDWVLLTEWGKQVCPRRDFQCLDELGCHSELPGSALGLMYVKFLAQFLITSTFFF